MMEDWGGLPAPDTKKIGEVLWWKGKRIVVVEGFGCDSCVFNADGCKRPYGFGVCTSVLRTDKINIHYEYAKTENNGSRQGIFRVDKKRRRSKIRRTNARR